MEKSFEYGEAVFTVRSTPLRIKEITSHRMLDVLSALAKSEGLDDYEKLPVTIGHLAGKYVALMGCTKIEGESPIIVANLNMINNQKVVESFYSWLDAIDDENLYELWDEAYEFVHNEVVNDETIKKDGTTANN